jgi:hypothetical protein
MGGLHPEYSDDIFIESARTLALRTAGKESAILYGHVATKYELILMPLAEGAGFPL